MIRRTMSFQAVAGVASGTREASERAKHAAVHDLFTTNVQVEDIDSSYTVTTAVAMVPLPLPPGAEARALLHHILEHGDILGRDTPGRIIIQLAVDDWTVEKLLIFDAETAEFEDGCDSEPDDHGEADGPPVPLEFVRPKMVERRRALALGCAD
jgi:hypothetical protein